MKQTASRRGQTTVTLLFSATSFLGSALLFIVEPIVARQLLPKLGGSASVWNTAVVFFQAALLAGYAAAHLAARLPVRAHLVVQVVLLGAAGIALPVLVPSDWEAPAGSSPIAWTTVTLLLVVGAPFLALASASPTLQHWFASLDHPSSDDPYFLYAASNAGSLIALLAYPVIVERALGLRDQAGIWAGGYGLLLVLTVACALVVRRRGLEREAPRVGRARPGGDQPAPGWPEKLRWAGLAAVPAALLLGVTRHIATDVASVPLLWVIPLALYLGTFIVAFGARSTQVTRIGAAVAAFAVVPAVVLSYGHDTGPLYAPFALGVNLIAFTAVATVAHGRLADRRPPSEDLTRFYFWVSLGGLVGGIAAALVAPLVFRSVVEFPLALIVGLALVPAVGQRSRRLNAGQYALGAIAVGAVLLGDPWIVVGIAAAALCAGLLVQRMPHPAAGLLLILVVAIALVGAPREIYADRTFYGVSRVVEDGDAHLLVSGTTVHGIEVRAGELEGEPMAYFTREGPIGQLLRAAGASGPLDVGVVGLGAGNLAAFARAEDRFTFYELDPAVVRIASDPDFFSFVHEAASPIAIEVGDGRRLLAQAEGRTHDVIVIDAFSSDVIPVHLLTAEAFDVYDQRLGPDGVLAVHVSNRYFGLAPQIAAQAERLGLRAMVGDYTPPRTNPEARPIASEWVVVARDDVVEGVVGDLPGWREMPAGGDVWTDDHADLLSTLLLW